MKCEDDCVLGEDRDIKGGDKNIALNGPRKVPQNEEIHTFGVVIFRVYFYNIK